MKQGVSAVVLVLVPLFTVLGPALEAAETDDPNGLKQRVEELEGLVSDLAGRYLGEFCWTADEPGGDQGVPVTLGFFHLGDGHILVGGDAILPPAGKRVVLNGSAVFLENGVQMILLAALTDEDDNDLVIRETDTCLFDSSLSGECKYVNTSVDSDGTAQIRRGISELRPRECD